MRFLHIADVHLGFQQYGLNERFNDFAKAFECAIEYGITQKVDAILIAGDLFHKSVIEPMAYIQVADPLRSARNANIPVIVVTGNHDQARYREQTSWLDVLASEGYLILLSPELHENICELTPWNNQTARGAYIDISNVRIIGVPYLGASAQHWLPAIAEEIGKLPKGNTNFTVFLTHAALEGELNKLSLVLTYDQLAPLRRSVDYLAMGHLHKPFQQEDWAYNPGSLEMYDITELQWNKGWYDVTVDRGGNKTVQSIPSIHRPFFSHTFSVGTNKSPTNLYRNLGEQIRDWAILWKSAKDNPVIELRLEGELSFERHELDIQLCQKMMMDGAPLLHCLISTSKLRSPGMDISPDELVPQDELERTILCDIARSDARFATHPEGWARAMLDVKNLAIAGKEPDEILDALQNQIDQIENGVDHVN